ncbi:MAG: hypothetical protein AAFW69_09820, partial [Pseudomonadota bacterium]
MGPAMRLLAFLLLAWAMLGAASPVSAQIPGYGALTGQVGEAMGEEEADPAEPAAPVPTALEPYQTLEGFEAGDLVSGATRRVDVARQRVARTLRAVPTVPAEIVRALQAKSPNGMASYFLGVVIFVSVLILIGRAFAVLFGVYVGRPVMVGLQKPNPQGYIDKLPVLATRMALTFVSAILMVGIAGVLGLAFVEGHEATEATAGILMASFAAFLMIDTTWRMMLCPFLPNYRIPSLSDEDAIKLYRWASAVSFLGLITLATTAWLSAMDVAPEA